jgi:uncharacterized metal-binding protein
MPSGRTHDLITLALAPAGFVGALVYWGRPLVALLATAAMIFAGLMFGPDLDLDSKQYRRWGPLRFIWFPYMVAFSHRSRLSHGLVLGTIFRVLYFIAVLALLLTLGLYLRQRYLYGVQTTWGAEFRQVSLGLGEFWNRTDKQYLWAAFAGLWLGAAAHTISDLIWSIAKKLWQSV